MIILNTYENKFKKCFESIYDYIIHSCKEVFLCHINKQVICHIMLHFASDRELFCNILLPKWFHSSVSLSLHVNEISNYPHNSCPPGVFRPLHSQLRRFSRKAKSGLYHIVTFPIPGHWREGRRESWVQFAEEKEALRSKVQMQGRCEEGAWIQK